MSEFWARRPVFVTGGTGLLGSCLVGKLVALGADVVCLLRAGSRDSEFHRSGMDRRTRVVRGDVCDGAVIERTLAEHGIKTVFHIAAQAIVAKAMLDPAATWKTNVEGTWTVLEACRTYAGAEQILMASSDKAYGVHEKLPYTEDAPLLGRAPYEASKACADLVAQSYAQTYQLPIAITRCGNFYGGGDLNWNRVVPGTIRSVLHGERPVIRSSGRFVRDYLYVEDGADAYLLLAEALARDPGLRGEAFNFAGGSIDVLGMVGAILAAMGCELEPVVLDQASNEIPTQILSSEKALRRLGWKPAHSLEQGLVPTIAWYKRYFDHE